MLYIIWGIAWVVTQRLMLAAGLVPYASLMSTIVSALVSIIAVVLFRESKLLITIACILIGIWCVMTLKNGEVINAVVGGGMNAALVAIAFAKKNQRG